MERRTKLWDGTRRRQEVQRQRNTSFTVCARDPPGRWSALGFSWSGGVPILRPARSWGAQLGRPIGASESVKAPRSAVSRACTAGVDRIAFSGALERTPTRGVAARRQHVPGVLSGLRQ